MNTPPHTHPLQLLRSGCVAFLATALLCLGVSNLCGCASFVPLVTTSAPTTAPIKKKAIELSFIEGRPNGVMLKIVWPAMPVTLSKGSYVLHIERQLRVKDAKPVAVQRIPLQPELIQRLGSTSGILFLDRTLRSPGQYDYTIIAMEQPASKDNSPTRVLAQSNNLPVIWRAPLPAPLPVRTLATRAPFHIEINWPQRVDAGAVIFRRDLLSSNRRLRRLATQTPAQGARYYDKAVKPGGVYAYRIAYARIDQRGQYYYGLPTQEIFVTVPTPKGSPEPITP